MTTDTSEKGLESLIVKHMTGADGLTLSAEPVSGDGGNGWIAGDPKDYDRACVGFSAIVCVPLGYATRYYAEAWYQ